MRCPRATASSSPDIESRRPRARRRRNSPGSVMEAAHRSAHRRASEPDGAPSDHSDGRLPPWSLRVSFQRLRERRRLPESGSPRGVKLSFEVIDSVTKPFLFSLELVTLTSQRVALRILGTLAPVNLVAILVA